MEIMEIKKSMAYLKAKKKVEAIKGLFGHIIVFIIINGLMILINSNVFNSSPIDFTNWGNYFPTIMWGIGLFFHIMFVFVLLNFNTNFIQRWEDKKIQEILRKEDEERIRHDSNWQ
jgi:hypothetical protein